MDLNNSDILFQEHMKIYILLKDKIIFETELENQNIEYYCDLENQHLLVDGIRYLILDNDRLKIDKILIENKIIANFETIATSDFTDQRKISNIYLKVSGIVAGIMVLIIIFDYFF